MVEGLGLLFFTEKLGINIKKEKERKNHGKEYF